MGSDFYFCMGFTHAVCQDYAAAGSLGNLAYALLSDGCSGSHIPGEAGSPYTDYGSRFMVRCAQRYLPEMINGRFPATAIVHEAAAIAHQARLPSVALDATLLAAVARQGGPAVTFQAGDGVIASKRRDGALTYDSIEFGNNMPYYMSYLLNPARLDALLHPASVSGVDPAAAGTWAVTSGIRRPGEAWERSRSSMSFDKSSPIEREQIFQRDDVELILLLSDGVESFQLKDGTPIPLEDVLDQLFDIKGFTGQFLTRRCTRFLQKFCVERGWQHADDLSVAGLYLEAP